MFVKAYNPGFGSYARSRGFNLIELMIALTLGLFVIAGGVSMFTSTLGSNKDLIASQRLNQDLSTVGSIISGELRRAGFGPEIDWQGDNGTAEAEESMLYINDTGDCVLFAYDEDNNGTLGSTDRRGFKLVDGDIWSRDWCSGDGDGNFAESDDDGGGGAVADNGIQDDSEVCSTSCSGAGWNRMLDDSTINVTQFSMNTDGSKCIHQRTDTYWLFPEGTGETTFPCRQWRANEDGDCHNVDCNTDGTDDLTSVDDLTNNDDNLTVYVWDDVDDEYDLATGSNPLPSLWCDTDPDKSAAELSASDQFLNSTLETRQVNITLAGQYLEDGEALFQKTIEVSIKVRNEQVVLEDPESNTCP